MQDLFDGKGIFGGEDCLFLNVFTPPDMKPDSKLPVGVYVHGGSYVNGAGDPYNATSMISYTQDSMILVSINYRLNVFGFLASDELRSLSPTASTGENGPK
jgi:carboxylesterase type B